MKKYVTLLLILCFLTGCSFRKVEEKSFESIIGTVLYNDDNLFNVNYEGFKFYLPRDASIDVKKESNLEIKYNDSIYYLYVDMVSYFYKTKKTHDIDNKLFYSKNLKYKDEFGYIDISKIDNKYFVEVMYNYAKIEAYVDENKLYDTFLNMCYILSTISFNDSTISYRLSHKQLETTTEEFNIFTSKKDNDSFLQYIEEYDKYINNNDKNKDQDVIDTDDD